MPFEVGWPEKVFQTERTASAKGPELRMLLEPESSDKSEGLEGSWCNMQIILALVRSLGFYSLSTMGDTGEPWSTALMLSDSHGLGTRITGSPV